MLLSPPSVTSATSEYCPGAEFVQVKSSVAVRRRISSHPSPSPRPTAGLGVRRVSKQSHPEEPPPQSSSRLHAVRSTSSSADRSLSLLPAAPPTVMQFRSIASLTALAEEVDSSQSSHGSSSSSSCSSWHDAAGDHSSCGCCRIADQAAVEASCGCVTAPCPTPAESASLTWAALPSIVQAPAAVCNAGEIPSTRHGVSALGEPAGPGPPSFPPMAELHASLGARAAAVELQTGVPPCRQNPMAAVAAAICHIAVDYCCVQPPAAEVAGCRTESLTTMREQCSGSSGETELAAAASVAPPRYLPADDEASRPESDLPADGYSCSVRRRPVLPPQLEFRQPTGVNMGNKLQASLAASAASSQKISIEPLSSHDANGNCNRESAHCDSAMSAATVSFPPPPSSPPSDDDTSRSAADESSQSDASFEDAFDEFEVMSGAPSLDDSAVRQSAARELAGTAVATAAGTISDPVTKADQSNGETKQSCTPVKKCQEKAVHIDCKPVADAVHQPVRSSSTPMSDVQFERLTVARDADHVSSAYLRPDSKSRLELARLRLTLDLDDSRLPWEAYNPARRLAQLLPSSAPVAEYCGDPDRRDQPQQQQQQASRESHSSWFASLPNTRKAKSVEPPSSRVHSGPDDSRPERSCSISTPVEEPTGLSTGLGSKDSASPQQPLPRSPTLLDELHRRYYGCQKHSPVGAVAADDSGSSNSTDGCSGRGGSIGDSSCSPATRSRAGNNATTVMQPLRLSPQPPTIVLLSPSESSQSSLTDSDAATGAVDEAVVAASCPTTSSASSSKSRMHMFGDVDKMFRSVSAGQAASTSSNSSRAQSSTVVAPSSSHAQPSAVLLTNVANEARARSLEEQPKVSHATGTVTWRLAPSVPKLNTGSSDLSSGGESTTISGARSRVAKLSRAFSLSPQILRRKYRSNVAPATATAPTAAGDLQTAAAVTYATSTSVGRDKQHEHQGSSLPATLSKKKVQEIEVLEACNWLADVGFPQYLQLFEEGQFPLELSVVEKDHAFLEPRLLQCLFRRLAVLNRCAHMKLELNNRKPLEVSVEGDQQQCALSDKWRINPKTGRWHRVGDVGADDCNSSADAVGASPTTLTSGMRCNDPLLPVGSSSELAAAGAAAAVSTGSPAAATLPGYRKHKTQAAAATPSTSSGLTAVRPSTLLRSLGGSLRSTRKTRTRQPLPTSETAQLSPADISGPVLVASAETDEKLRRLGCVDIGAAAARATSTRTGVSPMLGKRGDAAVVSSSDDTLNNNNIDSAPCPHRHKPAAGRSGWLVCPDDEDCSCHAALPGCVTAYLLPADYVPGTFPRALTKAVSLPAGCNVIGIDTPVSPVSPLPPTLPAVRDGSRVVQSTSLHQGLRSSPMRPSVRPAASVWLGANRHSVYDNVPTSATLSSVAAAAMLVGCSEEVGQLELALRELLELDRGADRQPSASPSPPQDRRSSSGGQAAVEKQGTPEKQETAALLDPNPSGLSFFAPTVAPTNDCTATGESCEMRNDSTSSAAAGAHAAESRNDAGIELDLVSASSSSNHEGTSDQDVPSLVDGSKEDLSSSPDVGWHRERRDSGVGSSLTREPSEGKKKPRLRWHSFVKSHRPSMNSENQHAACLPAGQLMVLQKLCKLYISSVLDEHCPPAMALQLGAVTNTLQLPKFGKRTRAPDYTSKQVFGVPLSVVQQRSGQPLPQCILYAMRYLRKNATDAVGIFRKSGVKSRIEKLHDDLEAKPDTTDFEGLQAYDVADLLKKYFRELPECLLTNQLSQTFLAIQQSLPSPQRLEAMQACVLLLPCENREVLEALLCFLSDMAAHSGENQMTASNLAVCFAPSLFDVCSRRGGSPMDSKATGRSGVAAASNKMTLPDQKELLDQKVAHECLTLMIANCRNLFKVPEDFLAQCHCSYMEAADPLPLAVLSPDYQSHIESCIQGLLKESSEGFKNWDRFEQSVFTHHPSSTTVELWSKKVGDGNPLRLWRASVDIEAAPADLLWRLLHERHLWDEDFAMWRSVEKLDASTDVFQYACNSVPPQPQRDYVELRSWRTELPGGVCVMVSHSVDCPSAQSPAGSDGTVRGVVLASSYLIEPSGARRSRLTHVSRVDMRGRTPDWYNRQYGHLEAACLLRLRDTFLCRQASTAVASAATSTSTGSSALATAFACSSAAVTSATSMPSCTFPVVPETSI